MKLPKHIGYFRRAFFEKYGVTPRKVRIQRSKETGKDYTIFEVPASTDILPEDSSLVIGTTEESIELAIRNYNFKYTKSERFDERGTLVQASRQEGGLNKKYIEGFKHSFREIFGEEPQKLCIWRNMKTGETYALFALPRDQKKATGHPVDTIVEVGVPYEGFLCRYRQMDRVPKSFFTDDGIKLDRSSAPDYGLSYDELRTDTDDYHKDRSLDESLDVKLRDAHNARERFSDLSEDEKEERRIRNREYYRKKSGYYERRNFQPEPQKPVQIVLPASLQPSAEHENVAAEASNAQVSIPKATPEERQVAHIDRDIDLMRERELEMKDPLSDEEFAELEQVRLRLYPQEEKK